MKFILSLAAAFMLVSAATAQPAKINKEDAKRIANATPALLSQTPTDNRPGTDAREANLKGRVKSITYRHSDGSDLKNSSRMLTSEEFYDEAGNRVRSVGWDDGRPINVTVYGYVDNMRVSRRGEIDYSDGIIPVLQGCVPLSITPTPKDEAEKLDDRYHTRWVSKYDDLGRLIEDQRISNAGRILTRTTYSYESATRRVGLYYGAASKPFYRVIEIMDPVHGNTVEEWLHHEDRQAHAVRYYTYKFDSAGNWIEQKVTERNLFTDRRPKPVSNVFRSITYYPGVGDQ